MSKKSKNAPSGNPTVNAQVTDAVASQSSTKTNTQTKDSGSQKKGGASRK